MPDSPIEPTPSGGYPLGMEARVAVLEQIARTTAAALDRIERRQDASVERIEQRLDRAEASTRADYRWVLGIMLGGFAGLLGVMAHGFHSL
jgi:uncharacterized damage-inducible protein DinB